MKNSFFFLIRFNETHFSMGFNKFSCILLNNSDNGINLCQYTGNNKFSHQPNTGTNKSTTLLVTSVIFFYQTVRLKVTTKNMYYLFRDCRFAFSKIHNPFRLRSLPTILTHRIPCTTVITRFLINTGTIDQCSISTTIQKRMITNLKEFGKTYTSCNTNTMIQ